MQALRRNEGFDRDVARKARLGLGALFLCAALAACGGGGGDAPASQSPKNTGAQNGGGTTNSGQIGAGGVVSSRGASSNGDTPTTVSTPPPAPTPSTPASGDSLVGVSSAKGATTLSWTPPTLNDDGTPAKLTGFRIYWGETEGNYSHSVTLDNPGLTRYVVEQLSPATWYFVATALSNDGESPPSNVVIMRVL